MNLFYEKSDNPKINYYYEKHRKRKSIKMELEEKSKNIWLEQKNNREYIRKNVDKITPDFVPILGTQAKNKPGDELRSPLKSATIRIESA